MTRLRPLFFTLIAVAALLGAACGGGDDDDGNGQAGGEPNDDATAAATNAPADNGGSDNGSSSNNGSDNGGGSGDFFQISGTGVLTIVVDGETHEFDVTCSADKGQTFDDEPIWDYALESADSGMVVQGTYQLVDGEETFNNLAVIGNGLTISASEFQDVTSGGTEWAGTFVSAGVGGSIEGTFETSCA